MIMLKIDAPISVFLICTCILLNSCGNTSREAARKETVKDQKSSEHIKSEIPPAPESVPHIDTIKYDQKMEYLANGDTSGMWPVKEQPYPLPGAILPFKRVVAYYGNLYSKKMGILGELPPDQMLARLDVEVKNWETVDPQTPVQPALHYIAVVAQADGGKDGKYRFRMPDKQIDSVLNIAKMRDNLIVFLDIQVALSQVNDELPRFEKYLKMPNVHLGIDPEFSMKNGARPGTVIGTFDAADINFCSDYLKRIVRENNLPPKIFIIHRFTKKMVTNASKIKLHPEVQIVMNMDGWGPPELKKGTYRNYIYPEPVQFTGFKLFYNNDRKKSPHVLMTPSDLMKLRPLPIYIQYQ